MKTSDFYYDLPPELIAQTPLENATSRACCVSIRRRGSGRTIIFMSCRIFEGGGLPDPE